MKTEWNFARKLNFFAIELNFFHAKLNKKTQNSIFDYIFANANPKIGQKISLYKNSCQKSKKSISLSMNNTKEKFRGEGGEILRLYLCKFGYELYTRTTTEISLKF